MANSNLYSVLSGLYNNDGKINDKVNNILTGIIGLTGTVSGTSAELLSGSLFDKETGKIREDYITIDGEISSLVDSSIENYDSSLLSGITSGQIVIGKENGIETTGYTIGSSTMALDSNSKFVGSDKVVVTEAAIKSITDGTEITEINAALDSLIPTI